MARTTATSPVKATMTDPARPARKRKPSPLTVFVTSAALFFAALGFLAYQLAQGHDPALGSGATMAEKPKRPVVTVRRIIKRRVITTLVPAPEVTSTPVSSGAAPTGTYSAPSTTAAPAPAAAPPPAPAPAVTATS
jgi:hypothetical protein